MTKSDDHVGMSVLPAASGLNQAAPLVISNISPHKSLDKSAASEAAFEKRK
jgi:hypothetical protein